MSSFSTSTLERLIAAVEGLRARAAELEAEHAGEIAAAHPSHREGARNLVHYLALRQHDIRALQGDLAGLGLSSLGRLEGHTMATLEAVADMLHRLAGRSYQRPEEAEPGVNPRTAVLLLAEHAYRLLGPPPQRRSVRIMVTASSEAAIDYGMVRALVEAGMNVMRINCAHDGPEAWKAIAGHVRRAERELGLPCLVQADLPGPKLRTGAIRPLGRALKLRPEKDGLGHPLAAARAWLTPAGAPQDPPPGVPAITVDGGLLSSARVGDVIGLRDARGRRRELHVIETSGASCVAEVARTTFVGEGAALELRRGKKRVDEGAAVGLPEVVEPILLRAGDVLVFTREDVPGEGARWADGRLEAPAHIHCSSAEAFAAARPGDRVFLDDAKIAGVVAANDGARLTVRIEEPVAEGGARLRAEKGINFPDTELKEGCLGPDDVAALEAVIGFVDMVALSFVKDADDLARLRAHLSRLGHADRGVVLKVESRAAFENLPRLLLAALQYRPVGVMVARGDLGVEVGFERLSEVQEEILWLCEAAHLPVIWATQVLEGMAKAGSPSRAEVTDAAMSGRAECVMLNKGPYIARAVEFLNGVLERMEAHQSKKTSMLRRLSVSENLGAVSQAD